MARIASGILFGKVRESRLYSLALNSKMTPFSFRRLDYFDQSRAWFDKQVH